jgi:hypothetical protein
MTDVRTLLTLAVLVLAAPALAQKSAPGSKRAWALVLGTSPDAAQAERLLRAFPRNAHEGLVLEAGYPRLVPAGTWEGIEPGHHAVVLGVCEDKGTVARLSHPLRQVFEGLRLTMLKQSPGEACPKWEGQTRGYRVERQLPVATRGALASARWVVAEREPVLDASGAPCDVRSYLLTVKEGDTQRASWHLPADCQVRSGEKAPSFLARWTVEPVTQEDGTTLLWAWPDRACCGGRGPALYAYAPGCGQVVEQRLLAPEEPQGTTRFQVEAVKGGTLRVTRSEGGKRAFTVRHYRWQPETCTFENPDAPRPEH